MGKNKNQNHWMAQNLLIVIPIIFNLPHLQCQSSLRLSRSLKSGTWVAQETNKERDFPMPNNYSSNITMWLLDTKTMAINFYEPWWEMIPWMLASLWFCMSGIFFFFCSLLIWLIPITLESLMMIIFNPLTHLPFEMTVALISDQRILI